MLADLYRIPDAVAMLANLFGEIADLDGLQWCDLFDGDGEFDTYERYLYVYKDRNYHLSHENPYLSHHNGYGACRICGAQLLCHGRIKSERGDYMLNDTECRAPDCAEVREFFHGTTRNANGTVVYAAETRKNRAKFKQYNDRPIGELAKFDPAATFPVLLSTMRKMKT